PTIKSKGFILIDDAYVVDKSTNEQLNFERVYPTYNEWCILFKAKKMIEENTIKSRIHEAIEKREFIVYLQPKVNLHSQKINCAEA
ncbi:hypothetical protein ACTPEM_24495, partial [Clostridioides difficile]